MQVSYSSTSLPILRSADVVIAGGSLAGIAAALALARAGHSVIIVEPRTYLGREVSATLSPWIVAGSRDLPALITGLLRESGRNPENAQGEIPLHMDSLKRYLEDQLLAAGVEFLYASQPAAILWENKQAAGLVVGNKSGRQVVTGRLLIDATETALLALLAGFSFEETLVEEWTRNIEFDAVRDTTARAITVPEELGIQDNRIYVHSGYRPDHVVVECRFFLADSQTGLSDMASREVVTRDRCMRLAAHLVHSQQGFEKAYLGNVAYELKGRYANPLIADPHLWGKNLLSEPIRLPESDNPPGEVSPGTFATPCPSLWMLNSAANLGSSQLWDNPAAAALVGEVLGKWLADHWKTVLSIQTDCTAPVEPAVSDPLQIREPQTTLRGRKYHRQAVPALNVPVLATTDVLVIGGGTSGAIAAYATANEGMNTFVVEMNPGLGGTGTYGGVHSYWCGYRGGFVSRVRRWVNQTQKELGLHGLNGYIPVWNMDSKAWALERQLHKMGVQFLYNARVCGAILDGNKVCGVVAATRLGPVAILGKITIDASGDGDVAAFAGADFVLGSERDHALMWYSLAQFFKPGRNRNNFTSPTDISNIEDYNRALLSGRRRGKVGEDHDHGIYIATRESRHIVGDVTVTLTDHLLHRAWEDVVCFAFSNNDIKGQVASEWFRIGLIPPHLEIEIPYRVMLPKGLENILVTGKAVSTTHDALPAIRMQPDLENMGGVCGLAAALAVKSGTTARSVPIAELQEKAVKYRVLTQRFITQPCEPLVFAPERLQHMVKELSADKPLYAYSDMQLSKVFRDRIPFVDITTAGPQVIPLLEQELSGEVEEKRRILLSQALCMVGSQAGVPVLVNAVNQMLSGSRLPERDFLVRQVDRFSPDQAAMPLVPYLLFSLAEARDRRAIPVWERVVDLLRLAEEEDIWSQRKGTFYYVDAVCVGAEKLGDPEAVPLLRKLHNYKPFHSKHLLSGFQADYLLERPAYLEVVIARALLRCGAPEGVLTLINYVQDVRALLAEQAHSELIAISGKDFGKDPAAWSQWLEQNSDSLRPVPWKAPSDAVAAWGETIYIRALK